MVDFPLVKDMAGILQGQEKEIMFKLGRAPKASLRDEFHCESNNKSSDVYEQVYNGRLSLRG
jgi:hypothetical protein